MALTSPHELTFRGVNLGRIDPIPRSAPAPAGRFTPNQGTDHSEIRYQVKSYIQFRIEADRLATDSPHSLEEFLQLAEPAFADLINSPEWVLVDAQGNRLLIRAPDFASDGTVRWAEMG